MTTDDLLAIDDLICTPYPAQIAVTAGGKLLGWDDLEAVLRGFDPVPEWDWDELFRVLEDFEPYWDWTDYRCILECIEERGFDF